MSFKEVFRKTAEDTKQITDDLASPFNVFGHLIHGKVVQDTSNDVSRGLWGALMLLPKSFARVIGASVKGAGKLALSIPALAMPTAKKWREERNTTKNQTHTLLSEYKKNLRDLWRKEGIRSRIS